MPFYRTTFCVTARGDIRFPLDMLRYDGCYPEQGSDVVALADALDPASQPNVIHYVNFVHVGPDRDWQPTADRWRSFAWRVMDSSEVEMMGRQSRTQKVPS